MLTEQSGLGNDIAQFIEPTLIGGARNPETDVAVDRVFLVHVLAEALPLLLVIEFRVVGQSKLYGTTEYCVDVDVAVGFGNNLAVEGTWRMTGRSAMVFDSLAHNPDLFW